jgi:hypothetical protein
MVKPSYLFLPLSIFTTSLIRGQLRYTTEVVKPARRFAPFGQLLRRKFKRVSGRGRGVKG